MNDYDVCVIGGGPAGVAVALPLARAGCSVLLLEAKPLPHEKLCGEFLSPECQALLAEMNLNEQIRALRPSSFEAANFVASNGTRWAAPMPGVAWGLSRYQFDYALLSEAQHCGGVVHDAEICIGVCGDLREGFAVRGRSTRSHAQTTYRARVIVSAHGKRSTMDRVLQRKFLGRAYPHFGMKRHFRGPRPPDGIAMHGFTGGYCGLAEIENGLVNLCFLADGRTWKSAAPPHTDVLSHLATLNSALGAWLCDAEPAEAQWHSVGALVFGARDTVCRDILLVGDAAGLIAPLVGDGIAMALCGGQLCARNVYAYLQGQLNAQTMKTGYTRAWRNKFLPRIRLAGWLQALALRPALFSTTLRVFQHWPALGQWMVKHTRA